MTLRNTIEVTRHCNCNYSWQVQLSLEPVKFFPHWPQVLVSVGRVTIVSLPSVGRAMLEATTSDIVNYRGNGDELLWKTHTNGS
jgi:hypothetical protein